MKAASHRLPEDDTTIEAYFNWFYGVYPGAEEPFSTPSRFLPYLPFKPTRIERDDLSYLRREDGRDVYLDLRTGKEVFVGRPSIAGDTPQAIFTRIQKIFHEALDIDAKMQTMLRSGDEQGLTPLFSRLTDELLPVAQQIVEDKGNQMAGAHFVVGLVLRILQRREEAELAFRKANDLQPDVINTLRELVRCLGEQGKNEEALEFARETVNVEPDDSGAWGNLAMCLIQCGERSEAREAIDRALSLDPHDPINLKIRENFPA